MAGWIGVDLDGTLAEYGGWKGGSIGSPLQPMLERIRGWLRRGQDVKIFTARVSRTNNSATAIAEETAFIQDWLEAECGLPRLEVTAEKDYGMIELWDDRAIQVEMNTGRAKYAREGL
jgi:hypothetical protein